MQWTDAVLQEIANMLFFFKKLQSSGIPVDAGGDFSSLFLPLVSWQAWAGARCQACKDFSTHVMTTFFFSEFT
jgi:hypothetical protein